MKKVFCLLISIILIILFAACSNKPNEVIDTNEESQINNIDKSTEDGLLFTTEYTIEDYVEDAIIVSKNDQLLYGVIDNNGNEVIPVKYDEIDFINKENYINGIDDELYFLVRYEGTSTVLNINAEEILSTSKSFWSPAIITTNIIQKTHTDNSPYFIERLSYKYALYNEKGDFLYEVASLGASNTDEEIWLSDSVFCYYSKSSYDGVNISTYNSNGERIDSLEGSVSGIFCTENKVLAFVYYSQIIEYKSEETMKLISIDTNGNITIEKDFDTLDEYKQELEQAEYEYGNKSYKLYTSNGTWKLEDTNGNALYDERYYGGFYPSGNNDCVALLNEDNQLLIISKTGKFYINYGILRTDDGVTIQMNHDGAVGIVDEIFEGKSSILIPVQSSESGFYDLYYFSEK